MIKIFPYCILVLLLICNAQSSYGQEADEELIDEPYAIRIAEISGELTKPINTFGDRMNDDAVGIGLAYLWQTKPESQVFMGIDFQWAPFYRVSTDFIDVVDGISTSLRERTRTTLWSSHFVTRFHPFNNFPVVDPFVEGLIGSKMIMTNTNISIVNTGENIDFIIDKTTFSFSYGFSAGFQIHLRDYRYYLFTKGTFLRGTSSEFFAIPEELAGQSNLTISNLDELNAPIDIVRWQVGLSVTF